MPTETSFARFLEAVPDAMVVVDQSGRIAMVNAHAERLFGASRNEVVGQLVETLMPPRVREAHTRHRGAYARHPIVRPLGVNLELVALRGDGTEVPVEISLSPLETDGRTLVVAAIRDITERKRAEEERAKLIHAEAARAEAEAANRAKDEFLAVLSHELRTPLQAMLGWTHMLRSGRLAPVAAQHALDVILQNIRHQTQLVSDLLDVSRIIAGKLQVDLSPLDLAVVIDSALETVRPVAQAKGVRLVATVDPDAEPVLGDADRLRQIVGNLVSNAVKFTPEGGRVDVRLDRAGGRTRIVVRDTGRGIAAELLPHIFERFRQADTSATRLHGGLGLGLAISRHLVDLHGGTITVESAGDGQGASFTVELPIAGATAARPIAPSRGDRPASEPMLTGVKVLVVDDDPGTLEVLATVLRQHGAIVTPAGSTREALAVMDGEELDVLVSDIAMPGEDGYRLIERVRTRPKASSIPAVAVTAYARAEDRDAALRAGYHAYVAKPVEPETFTREVARLVRRV
jgi:PAS domain S-box-containing protein